MGSFSSLILHQENKNDSGGDGFMIESVENEVGERINEL